MIVADKASGPSHTSPQLPNNGSNRLKTNVARLDRPNVAIINISPVGLFSFLCFTKKWRDNANTTAGTIVAKKAIYAKYRGPMFIVTELPVFVNKISVYSNSGFNAISSETIPPNIINTQVIILPNFCIQEVYAKKQMSRRMALINVNLTGQDNASSEPGPAIRNAEMVTIQTVAKIAASKNQRARTRYFLDEPQKTVMPESIVRTETVTSKITINCT